MVATNMIVVAAPADDIAPCQDHAAVSAALSATRCNPFIPPPPPPKPHPSITPPTTTTTTTTTPAPPLFLLWPHSVRVIGVVEIHLYSLSHLVCAFLPLFTLCPPPHPAPRPHRLTLSAPPLTSSHSLPPPPPAPSCCFLSPPRLSIPPPFRLLPPPSGPQYSNTLLFSSHFVSLTSGSEVAGLKVTLAAVPYIWCQ